MHELIFKKATKADLEQVLALQKLCYQSEAALYNDYSIQPLTQTIEELNRDCDNGEICLIAVLHERIIGAVRGCIKGHTGFISKLIVTPRFQNQGIGRCLMERIEETCNTVYRYELFTGCKSSKNIALYKKLGYAPYREEKISEVLTLVHLEKINGNRNDGK